MADDNVNDKEEKERKGGAALPSWMQGAASVGGRAAGGLPGGGMAARLAALATSKAAILATVFGGMAIGGVVTYNEIRKTSVRELPAVGSAFRARSSDSESGPLLGSARVPSSLDMAARANKGLYGDAAPAAKPEAKTEDAGADSKDAAKGDTLGKDGKPVAGDAQAQAQQMADSLMKGQAAEAQGQSPALQRKFGNMTANLGGGNRQLAGGAGLSGGIGQNFGQSNLNNTATRQMSAMSGARRAQVAQAKTAVASRGSNLSGATAQRLDKMNMAMGGARKESVATQSAVHAQQWDGAQAGGQSIQGAGAGGGGFSSDEGGGGGNPVNQESGAKTTPNAASTTAPSTGDTGNKTPYQGMLDLAVGMLMLASIIITVIGILAIKKNTLKGSVIGAGAGEALEGIQLALLAVATCMAGIAAVMGGMIASQGQSGQGSILCVAGGIEAAAGVSAMLWPNKMPAALLALAGVAGLVGSITSLLAK